MKSSIKNLKSLTTIPCLNDLTIFSISDLHANNRRVGARTLCSNIITFLGEREAEIEASDVFIIGGDFFDTILFHPSEDTKFIYEVMFKIIGMCAELKTKLRVVNGTRTHDWDQCRDFIYLSKAFGDLIDIRYIEDMEIEIINGKSIMYVPDELHHESQKTYEQAQEMISERGWTTVDVIMIHGGFTYQLDFPGVDAHDQHLWMGLVKYLIISGHIHVSIPYGKIVPNGSFDSLVFGESRDKGGWLFCLSGEVAYKLRLPNKNAVYFDIFTIEEEDSVEDALGRLKTLLSDRPDHSFISIRVPVGHAINNLLPEIKRTYPFQNFYKETLGTIVQEVEEIVYESVEINERNILKVFREFTNDNDRQSEMIELLESILEE